ncbi:DUF4138 domain-containing protein [Galbibacter sp. BG1]|uniref:DUF4138 domain-containing protein n=1 Tax=Galbibacter sp. BG1 TaxID=1170699 RepID=UPI0015BE3C9E|nr:DUF4138 domain-containing protein [Galbibacter sp. BG1]QLE02010.1 DUF4138 domain-containing protein [Galbibacter sp. BG1]
MKNWVFVIVVCCIYGVHGQERTDTIYVNEKKVVGVFFPSGIRQAIVGGNHFSFTYNKEKMQYFGLVQGVIGDDGNLLCVTAAGKVYSFILSYRDSLPKLNYFVGPMDHIGLEKPVLKEQTPKVTEPDSLRYERFCKYLLGEKSRPIKVTRQNGLILKMEQLVYHGDEMYLVMEFINNSEIDFEVGSMEMFRIRGDKKRKASFQELKLNTIAEHGAPSVLKSNGKQRFVIVFSKYVSGKGSDYKIFFSEENGHRILRMSVSESLLIRKDKFKTK